ncbi:TPA: hypothetical protein RU600_001893 [Salmonella enterica]|nr:hypothetical protein [Salmonella enterica]HEA0390779.1 hypothetical protein [Salmonella enterica]
MTDYSRYPAISRDADAGLIRTVLQQAIDQYPRLAAFLLTLPDVIPETVKHFHDSVYQQVSGLAISRQRSGRPVPPTVLRWMWEKKNVPGQSCRHLLLMNQDTFCHPRYDVPADRCSDTMEALLRDAAGTINDVRHHPLPEITVFRVDRTRPAQAGVQYSRLRDCALSLVPGVTARSERISA